MQELVVFRVGKRFFCLEREHVQEVNRVEDVTPMPRSPAVYAGVISLRGNILTLFDIAALLGDVKQELDKTSRYIVFKTDGDEQCGLVVDEIHGIVKLSETVVKPATALTTDLERRIAKRVYEYGEKTLLLVDRQLPYFIDDIAWDA